MPPANSPAEAGSPAVGATQTLAADTSSRHLQSINPLANSHPQDRSRPATPASFRSALRDLASPVPDYASTLTIQTEEDDIDAENISFLRTPYPALDEEQTESPAHQLSNETAPTPQQRQELQERQERILEQERQPQWYEQARREVQNASRAARARRQARSGETHELLADGRRYDAGVERMSQHGAAAYGDRIPNQQSLYDWAPATDEREEEELEAVLSELRRQHPTAHPELLRVLAGQQLVETSRDSRNRSTSGRSQSGTHQEPSLRSAAILQSVRRNWRFSTRSRMLMSRYVMERERNAQENETSSAEANHSTASERTAAEERAANDLFRGFLAEQQAQRTPQESMETLRRRYLHNPSNKSSAFQQIIEYLHCQSAARHELSGYRDAIVPEAVTAHSKTGATGLEQMMESGQLRPPPTSWLAAGTTFTGHQSAMPLGASSTALYRLASNQSSSPANLDPANPRSPNLDMSQPWLAQHLTATPLSFQSSPAAPGTPASSPPHDRWTVKVAIHAVDYESMTLQGTMEAFNVPSVPSQHHTTQTSSAISPRDPNTTTSNELQTAHSSNSNKTTFSTYLEGEIVDFSKHTLLTEPDHFAVKTNPTVDALYWRRLEPFAKLSDSEIARAMLDRNWVEENLTSRYVLMRWKERCFVKPTFTSFSNVSSSQSATSANSRSDRSSSSFPHQRPHQSHQPHQLRRRQQQQPQNHPDQHPTFAQLSHHHDSLRNGHTPTTTTTSFLSGADGNGYGLSISGFYYVSLRRSDGRCEGLYYDPQSSPYQHLDLRPTEGTWGSGSWEFR